MSLNQAIMLSVSRTLLTVSKALGQSINKLTNQSVSQPANEAHHHQSIIHTSFQSISNCQSQVCPNEPMSEMPDKTATTCIMMMNEYKPPDYSLIVNQSVSQSINQLVSQSVNHKWFQVKCAQYWPTKEEGMKEYQAPGGSIIVKFKDENETTDYMRREFEVSKVGEVCWCC